VGDRVALLIVIQCSTLSLRGWWALRPIADLLWDANNVASLASHGVTPDEIEEALGGCDGESATYRQRRDGEYMQFFGRTGDGRLLAMVGEIFEDGRLRVFHANDMTKVQARAFKKG